MSPGHPAHRAPPPPGSLRMSYQSIKWIIFTTLAMTVPAMLFFVMAFMFMPAIFFIAGIGYVIPKLFRAGSIGESMSFIVILGVHALIYTAIYYGISVVIAKVIDLIKSRAARWVAVAIVCLGFGATALFPVYGGGGHGPMYWYTLAEFLADMNRSYGTGSAQIVYGAVIFVLSVYLLRQYRRNRRSRPGEGIGQPPQAANEPRSGAQNP